MKILLSNLKSKREEMEHVKLDDYLTKERGQVKYMAGDLLMFDNYSALGLVLHVHPDFLRVLTTNNEVISVRHQAISKKIFGK